LEIQENNVNNITHAIRNDEKFIDKTLSKGPTRETKSREEQHQKEFDLVLSFERNFKEVRKAIKDLSPH
jgi:hypothetical protein